MKILVFLQGTIIMHKNAVGKTREEVVEQVKNQEKSVRDFGSYVPIGKTTEKLNMWKEQGAQILYLSSLIENKKIRDNEVLGKNDPRADQEVLNRHEFPKGTIYHRQKGETYAQIAERIVPNVLIEDDCESIGGEKDMTITYIKLDIKRRIKSIPVKEFGGIDHLPDNLNELLLCGS